MYSLFPLPSLLPTFIFNLSSLQSTKESETFCCISQTRFRFLSFLGFVYPSYFSVLVWQRKFLPPDFGICSNTRQDTDHDFWMGYKLKMTFAWSSISAHQDWPSPLGTSTTHNKGASAVSVNIHTTYCCAVLLYYMGIKVARDWSSWVFSSSWNFKSSTLIPCLLKQGDIQSRSPHKPFMFAI